MKWIVPDYYARFSCLMGACRHSCCIGWEIDIDPETLAHYQTVPGDIGARLMQNIALDGENAHFRLNQDERCPFLNQQGLCDLILTLGEDSLCQICADHPRFRNHYADRVEVGLGLCCEAAGQLILAQETPVQLTIWQDDEQNEPSDPQEIELLSIRDGWIKVMQNRTLPFWRRLDCLAAALPDGMPKVDYTAWSRFLLTLERLDETWADCLHALEKEPAALPPLPDAPCWDIAFEQLAVYLLYRHIPGTLEDGDLEGRLKYVLLICRLLYRLCLIHQADQGSIALSDLVEYARLYSSEIEYSDENLWAILDELQN